VEFALVIPLLLLVLVGIVDFGRAIFAYNGLSNAARSAVREAIVNQTPSAIQDVVTKETIGLITTSDVTYTDGSDPCTPVKLGCIARVEVQHDFQPATPILNAIVGPIILSSTAKMPVERVYTTP
jgi:Flp pilus assembly protein TadG